MQQGTTLPGDVLLVTAFISYVGCFTKQYRLDLVNKMWLPFLRVLEVRGALPIRPDFGVPLPSVTTGRWRACACCSPPSPSRRAWTR